MTTPPGTPPSIAEALHSAATSVGAMTTRATISGTAGLVGALEALNTGIDAAMRCGDSRVNAALSEARLNAALALQRAAQEASS